MKPKEDKIERLRRKFIEAESHAVHWRREATKRVNRLMAAILDEHERKKHDKKNADNRD